jgi:NAD(P)-dependent dehydrogenase (short-subunit alcohol dehydrogenase family)
MSTVVITGSNRGIGLELARRHSERGDHVIAVCRSPSRELQAIGVEIVPDVDMANDASAERLGATLKGRVVDRVIANAGIRRIDTLDALDLQSIRYQYEVNTLGPLRLVSSLRNALTRGSKVVLVSSRVGSIADNRTGANFGYRMSKAALNMVGKNLALALREDGIAVFLLHPGFVRTNLTGGEGNISAAEAAPQLISLTDKLGLHQTGTFWHVQGMELPW